MINYVKNFDTRPKNSSTSTFYGTRAPWATSLTWETSSNQHIWFYHINYLKKKIPIISFVKIDWLLFFIWPNLNPLHTRMLCAKFDWNWPSNFRGDFKISSMYFDEILKFSSLELLGPVILEKNILKFHQCILLFRSQLPLKKGMALTNLNLHHPRMPCVKFGWNWPSGSGEEDNF